MGIDSLNGVNGVNQAAKTQKPDKEELEVAQKLIAAGVINSVQEFMQLSETEKQTKVEEYNKTHPNNPIADKNKRDNAVLPPEAQTTQQAQGTVMNQFMNDVDWKKIKLQ